MTFIDRGFRAHPLRYVLQCLLAGIAVMVVLLLVDAVAHTVLIAALGASAFVVFTMPELSISGPRHLIGGYVVGVAVGALLWLVHDLLFHRLGLSALAGHPHFTLTLFGGLAVGVAIFLMVITDTEHPPAAGVTLGLVVNPRWDLRVLLVILLAIVALCLVRFLLRPALKNLL